MSYSPEPVIGQNQSQQRVDPDLLLVHAIAEGDSRALDELYARRGGAILGFLVARLGDRQLAEELLQDVMLSAWRSAASFRGESKVLTWLLTIARNRAINATRRQRPIVVDIDAVFDLQGTDTGPLEKVERKDKQTMIAQALRHLPAGQREVLVLVFYHQLTGPEVAEVLGISPGTVKSRLHRAKETLRQVLQGEESL